MNCSRTQYSDSKRLACAAHFFQAPRFYLCAFSCSPTTSLKSKGIPGFANSFVGFVLLTSDTKSLATRTWKFGEITSHLHNGLSTQHSSQKPRSLSVHWEIRGSIFFTNMNEKRSASKTFLSFENFHLHGDRPLIVCIVYMPRLLAWADQESLRFLPDGRSLREEYYLARSFLQHADASGFVHRHLHP